MSIIPKGSDNKKLLSISVKECKKLGDRIAVIRSNLTTKINYNQKLACKIQLSTRKDDFLEKFIGQVFFFF